MASTLNPLRLSEPAVLLLAANLASEPLLLLLRALVAVYPDVLHFSALSTILLEILPESTPPEDYLPLLYRSYRGEPEQLDISRIPKSYVEAVSLSPGNLQRRLATFNLSNVPAVHNHEKDEEALTKWFFERARRVEEATGMIDLARQVVLPDITLFAQSPPFPPTPVIIWAKGVVQVFETFIFDNDDEDDLQLATFENLDAESAIRLLLSRTTADTVSRNIRNLVAPYILYVKCHEPGKEVWGTVYEWLLDHATTGELEYIANAVADLPDDVDRLKFLHTCLTACYLYRQSSPSVRQSLHRIRDYLSRSSEYMNAADEPILLAHPETDLLPSQLRESSPLTALNTLSLKFLHQIITSADIIAQYSFELSLRELVTIREGVQEVQEVQKQLMDRLLQSGNWKKRNEGQWKRLRESLKWLQLESLVLGKVSDDTLDSSILSALLDSSGMCHVPTSNVAAFGLAREMYVRQSPLPSNMVEKTILDAFYRFYDNATNGNRTRGGMKNAFQTYLLQNTKSSLHVLDDPSSIPATSAAVKLVSATHALSNYSLSITPGVPLTPAQIRMTKDPALLVCKAIESNSSTYRETDRMIKVLTDLIDGTGSQDNTNAMKAKVYVAITTAALSENDFPAAYETCISKLSPLTDTTDNSILTTAWVAFYNAGMYNRRPRSSITSDQLTFQKMELLARAVLICPKEKLATILREWTTLETTSLHPEQHHPRPAEHRGFLETAAQVARTASPLISGGRESFERERTSGESSPWGQSTSRFGVRDTVKTGLTQGLGWLLGATPQQDTDEHT
jgi:hypothetical protein